MGRIAQPTLEQLARAHDPTVLRGQFVLGRDPRIVPPGWDVRRLAGWVLVSEPSLPVLSLEGHDGRPVGWVLGHPVDLEGGAIIDTALAMPDEVSDESSFHEWLYRHGGRYVAVVIEPRPLLYPDACATLPVFYGEELGAAASSLFLLPDDRGAFPQSELSAVFDVHNTMREHQLGFSAHALANHLMANHVLDLRTWQAHRAWPTCALEEGDLSELAGIIGDVTERTIDASVARGHVRMGLTAGGDSRVLLAAARHHVDDIEFFTLRFNDGLGVTDCRWGTELARRFALPHRVVPWQEPHPGDEGLWLYRTGGMSGEPRGRHAARTFAVVGGDGPFLAGTNGGQLRSHYWAKLDYRGNHPLSSSEVLHALARVPRHPRLVARADAWLEELPAVSRANAFALLVQEAFDAPWVGLQTVAHAESRPLNIYPFTHRAVVEAALRSSVDDRLADRVRRAVVERSWPELLEIPINRRPASVVIRHKLERSTRKAAAGRRKVARYGRRFFGGAVLGVVRGGC